MKAKENVEIEIRNQIDIDISGPKELKDEMIVKAINIRTKANEANGEILRDKEFADGFSFTISFTNQIDKRLFEMAIGL